MYRVQCTHVLGLTCCRLEVFLLCAEYLKAEGREDALETVLVPLLLW